MEEKNCETIFICSYGQTGVPICVDPSREYCKLKSMDSKKCDFRKVVNYTEYEKLREQLQALRKENDILKESQQGLNTIREIAHDYKSKYEASEKALKEIKEVIWKTNNPNTVYEIALKALRGRESEVQGAEN